MSSLTLRCQAHDGQPLEATFLRDKGMNMVSYRKGNVEIMDQSTKDLFEERYAGLGALIGPHFHRRNPSIVPKVKDEALFPHIARVHAHSVQDPFSHGIARYAPWSDVLATPTTIRAVLTGKDTWNGVPLSELEGQNFRIGYDVDLTPDGLALQLSIVSDIDSLVGTHFYYHLPKGKGVVTASVNREYLDDGHPKFIDKEWNYDDQQLLRWDLSQEADYTFHPFPNPLDSKILLDAIDYRLTVHYQSISQESCWQLYHPQGASYACIEPISALDPHHPNLSVSSIRILLSIETP